MAGKIVGVVEVPLGIVGGALAGIVGSAYGVYYNVRNGKYGTPGGMRESTLAASRLSHRLAYNPSTVTGDSLLRKTGEFVHASGIAGLGFSELNALGMSAKSTTLSLRHASTSGANGSNSGFRTGAYSSIEAEFTTAPGPYSQKFGSSAYDGKLATSVDWANNTPRITERTVLSTGAIDEQVAHAVKAIPGLSETQARALLEASFHPNKPVEVVIGGSRVRSFFGEGKYRPDSDLDIGFNAKMKNKQIDTILDAFDSSGSLASERGIRIFSGNKPPSGLIESPQEFFQRSGIREFPPARYGEPFSPSGYISYRPDGTITIVPPGKH